MKYRKVYKKLIALCAVTLIGWGAIATNCYVQVYIPCPQNVSGCTLVNDDDTYPSVEIAAPGQSGKTSYAFVGKSCLYLCNGKRTYYYEGVIATGPDCVGEVSDP